MDPTLIERPSSWAVTEITASEPTLPGCATQRSPLRVSVPLVIVACTAFIGTPGTEMLIGLAMPAYRTFIIVGEIVAIGSITVYDDLNGWRASEPSPRATSM